MPTCPAQQPSHPTPCPSLSSLSQGLCESSLLGALLTAPSTRQFSARPGLASQSFPERRFPVPGTGNTSERN